MLLTAVHYLTMKMEKVYTTADTIDILFTPDASTGNAYSLNELTAGEIKFKFEICDLN